MWYGDVDIDDKEDACRLWFWWITIDGKDGDDYGACDGNGGDMLMLILMIRRMLADCAQPEGGRHGAGSTNLLIAINFTPAPAPCTMCSVHCAVYYVQCAQCTLQAKSTNQLHTCNSLLRKYTAQCKVQHIKYCTLQFWHQQFAVQQHQLILQTSKHCISATDYRCSLYFIMFCYVHNIAIEHVRCEICNRLQNSHCTVPLLQSSLYR